KINRVLVGFGVGAERCARCGSYYWHQLPPYPGNWIFLIGIAVTARRKQLFFCVVFAAEKWHSQCLLLMKHITSPLLRARRLKALPGAAPAKGVCLAPGNVAVQGSVIFLINSFASKPAE